MGLGFLSGDGSLEAVEWMLGERASVRERRESARTFGELAFHWRCRLTVSDLLAVDC